MTARCEYVCFRPDVLFGAFTATGSIEVSADENKGLVEEGGTFCANCLLALCSDCGVRGMAEFVSAAAAYGLVVKNATDDTRSEEAVRQSVSLR